jgi:hypothetical protein
VSTGLISLRVGTKERDSYDDDDDDDNIIIIIIM